MSDISLHKNQYGVPNSPMYWHSYWKQQFTPTQPDGANDAMPNGMSNGTMPPRGSNGRNGNGAADQITLEHIADFVGMVYHKFSPGEQDALCQQLQELIDVHNGSMAGDEEMEPRGSTQGNGTSLIIAGNRGSNSPLERGVTGDRRIVAKLFTQMVKSGAW